MKISIRQFKDLLVTLTHEEPDKNLFCSEILIQWEDEEVLRNDTRQVESHTFSISWDLDEIGWTVDDFHWVRPTDKRVMIWTHNSSFSDVVENESEFSNLLFDLGGNHSNYRWNIDVQNPVEDYEIDVNLLKTSLIQVTKLKLRGDPFVLKSEVSNFFKTQMTSSRSSGVVIDQTMFDENGHIHIDDWNPYESVESYFGIDTESMMLDVIWKKTVEELQFPLDVSVLDDQR